jgi:hypothetical protein
VLLSSHVPGERRKITKTLRVTSHRARIEASTSLQLISFIVLTEKSIESSV